MELLIYLLGAIIVLFIFYLDNRYWAAKTPIIIAVFIALFSWAALGTILFFGLAIILITGLENAGNNRTYKKLNIFTNTKDV